MPTPAVTVEAQPAGCVDSILVTCKLRSGVWRLHADHGLAPIRRSVTRLHAVPARQPPLGEHLPGSSPPHGHARMAVAGLSQGGGVGRPAVEVGGDQIHNFPT